MTGLALFKGEKTMSSLEVSTLTGKRHDNVKRTIETLVEGGVMTQPQIEEVSFLDALGRTVLTTAYQLGERDSYIVVAQLSPHFTAALVDRWRDLETAVLQTRADLRVSSTDFARALKVNNTAKWQNKLNAARCRAEKAGGFRYNRYGSDGMGGVEFDARLIPTFLQAVAPAHIDFTNERYARLRELVERITGGNPALIGLPNGGEKVTLLLK